MTAPSQVRSGRAGSLLRRNPALLRLLIAASISSAGDWCYGVLLVVWVTERTGADPAWIAVATVARLLPYAFAAPLGGLLADRIDRRRILVTTSALRALLLIALALAIDVGAAIPVAIAIVVAAEALGALHRPSVLSSIPDLVGERELATANASFGGLMQMALLAGPAIAAAGLAVTGLRTMVMMCAVVFVGAAAVVPRMSDHASSDAIGRRSLVGGLLDGVRSLGSAPGLPAILGLVAVSEFVFGAEGVGQVLVASDRLGRPASIGVLVAAVGVGGLIAAPFIPRIAARPRLVLPFVIANMLGGIPLMLLSLPRSVWAAVALLIIEGCGVIAYEVLLITLLQRVVRRDMLGRIFGLQEALVIGSQLLGAVAAPVVIDGIGLQAALVLLGATLTAASLALWIPMGRADDAAEARARRLAPFVAEIRGLGIFDGVPQALLEQVAFAIEEREVSAGRTVIREGDEADLLFIIRAGRFIATTSAEGDDRVLSTMGPGEWFGEIGLLRRSRRTATVRAQTDAVVWSVPGDVFLEAVEGGSAVADPLQRTMLRRLANHAGEAA